MNNNKKVVFLIVVVTIIHLLLSVFSSEFIGYYPNFKNVNLLSDILYDAKSTNQKSKQKEGVDEAIAAESLPYNDFSSFVKKGTIVAFNGDTIEPALKSFNEKLIMLSQNKKVKIRIAWFGDSQIEGDFITQDLRVLLQNYFGQQAGVGFIPINSISSDFRHSAKLITTGDVKSDNFKKSIRNSSLFFSGYSFFCNDLGVDFKDNVKKNPEQITQKWLLFGKGDSIAVRTNDTLLHYPADKEFNRVLLNSSASSKLHCQINGGNTPLYGISSEPQSGIVVDNFSFRGITGVELKKLDTKLLEEINQSGYYDLVIFQYGVNLMYKPNDTNYKYYYRAMNPVLKKLKTHMNKSEFLLFGCSDRAFNYDGEWKTAVGIDSLITIQAKLAYNNNIPFYNLYKSMGGNGTIVKWADSLKYANKDYIHFNHRGAKVVAGMIYKAILNDYNKAVKKKSNQQAVKVNSKKDIKI
ncbi:hypothetical protein OX284_012525 [Flavobacterium sp. SUN046]|uniref:hypothetical protein n=1 Tax=Flavobacterium sp. SUN046 TaxID=3002440 RepID=UPI002DBA483B|nr:hypothetical protein [Flavobacterium sp. SUN046]MEC4050259.1 hypothetical protein [Flavobacterium sp. SUN046]